MDIGLLETLLGGDRSWSPPCTVVLAAEATVKSPGPDNIGGGGVKTYAPRYTTGRVEVDTCCLLRDHHAMVIVQQQKYRDSTGREVVQQTVVVADLKFVAAIEFPRLDPIAALGLPAPPPPQDQVYRPGTLVG